MFSLYNCIRRSSNSLLLAFLNSDVFFTSKIVRKWRASLYAYRLINCFGVFI